MTEGSSLQAFVDAEVDYVKFQTFKADKLVSKSAVKAEYQTKNIEEIVKKKFYV